MTVSEEINSRAIELKQGFNKVSDTLDAENSTFAVDAFLAELAGTVEESSRMIAVDILVSALRSNEFSAVREIAQYFAFRFRWQELRMKIETLLSEARSSKDLRKARSLETILDAFSDDWEDVDLFPSLQGGPTEV